ncbi:ABC transporter substrate-binding protein [Lewinella sp. 4G2]|uniref:ABC transporter substrate-binding protein n=1 Tax=Lewinella sp. 4G2 TaxID=1803372 RepID=UPI0007B46F52|nr:extracellular solute-binding protein [Lewinella sp. 4G2]OAV44730.1 hypothetical protein A3850_009610 [Lewinella sp. 4G2]
MLTTLRFTLLAILLCLVSCKSDRKPASKTTPGERPVGLTVVTWRHLAQDAAIIKAFEDRMRIDVKVVIKPMREIMAGAAAGAGLEGDVVLVPTLEDAARLRGFDVLQPFFVNAFTQGEVSDAYVDNEGYYSGLTRWTMATVYNPNAVTAEEASTYRGVLEAPLRGIRLGAAHPDSSGLAGVIAGLNATLNQQAADFWAQGIYNKAAGGLQGNDYDVLERMLAGELDMAFVSSGAVMRWFLNGNQTHYAAGDAWRVKLPRTQATDDNFMNMTCITVPATAPNRVMALNFIDYLYEKNVQTQLTDAYFEYPTQSFTESNEYLYGIRDVIGRKPVVEVLENNLPLAWSLINREAGVSSE